MKVDFCELAHRIKFRGFSYFDVEALRLEYRKGKSFEDIKRAVQKAHKNGHFKTKHLEDT